MRLYAKLISVRAMAENADCLLDLREVETSYGLSRVLFGVSLTIARGEMVSLLGRNGMGKTTTVLSIAHKLLDEFLGAVCIVELSPVESPLLPSTIASAFRLSVRA